MTRDHRINPLQVLSLGGGTQSTALMLMVRDGDLPVPDLVIFADTGSELPFTLDVIGKCQDICLEMGIDFQTVFQKDKLDLHQAYHDKNSLPLIGFRTCTTEWKIRPIYRKIREYVGMGRGKVLASSWIGITTDESHRATESEHKWIERKYPLIEKGMSRDDCIKYCNDRGFEVQKSGCFCCPYQPKHQWEALKKDYPKYFDIALEMEKRALDNGFTGGLYRSQESIQRFNHSHTLLDFGMKLGDRELDDEIKCDPGGGCFL